jgi:hypothetical protein
MISSIHIAMPSGRLSWSSHASIFARCAAATFRTPATPSAISRAFLGASLAFVFVYLGGVGVITALIRNALFAAP